MINDILDGGGFNLPLWKMMDFVSWDDDIPNRKIKTVPTHQKATMGIMNNKVMYIQVWIHSIWNLSLGTFILNSGENSNPFLKPPYP